MKSILTILLVTMTFCMTTRAQNSEEIKEDFFHPLKLKFVLLDTDGEPVRGCQVNTYKGNKLIKNSKVKGNRHKSMCISNNIYTIEIIHPDYITKRVAINAFHKNKPLYNDVYKFFVELETKGDYDTYASAEDYLDYPAVILEYDERSAEFTYNTDYLVSSRIEKKELKLKDVATITD